MPVGIAAVADDADVWTHIRPSPRRCRRLWVTGGGSCLTAGRPALILIDPELYSWVLDVYMVDIRGSGAFLTTEPDPRRAAVRRPVRRRPQTGATPRRVATAGSYRLRCVPGCHRWRSNPGRDSWVSSCRVDESNRSPAQRNLAAVDLM